MRTKTTAAVMIMFFSGVGITGAKNDGLSYYHNQETAVSFSYPKTLTIDKQRSKEQPLSVVFQVGVSPFVVSILFKQVSSADDLEKFISQERRAQEVGGYRDQIQENWHKVEGKTPAIEFIRTSEIGEIYYFVFQSQKSNELFAFWHATSKIADPEAHAVRAYRLMINSLKLSY